MSRRFSAPRCAEEPVEDALNIIEMVLLDILAMLELVSEQRGARAAHPVKLLRQIRQVLHRRRWRLAPLRHLDAAATPDGSSQHIAQDLTEDVAARHLPRHLARHLRSIRSGGHRRPLPARHGYLDGPPANDHRLDATLADSFLKFAQNVAEEIAFGRCLVARLGRSGGRRNGRRRNLRSRAWRRARRSRHSTSEYL